MKKITFIAIAIISAALFVYSTVHLKKQLDNGNISQLGEVQGFDAINPTDEYNNLVKRFQATIQLAQEQANQNQNWYFWMSFTVTALTAASTLVSSIEAAKPVSATPAAGTKKFAIIVAVLTFCSSLSSFASTHFNDLKIEHMKKATDITTKLNQFYSDYDKASEADKPKVIMTYGRQIPQI